MTRARTLKDEVSQLQTDADRKRPARKPRSKSTSKVKAIPESNDDSEDIPEEQTETLKDLSEQLSDLVHDAENEIREHPVAVVLGAFALGIVVGAVLRR
ncbi:MAG: hypothetical protein ABJL55_21030 [Roseibium sp.]